MSIKGHSISYWYFKQSAQGDYGVDPEYKPLNRTGGMLKEGIEKVRSNELQTGRQRSSLIATKHTVDGQLNSELSAQTMDDFIAAALQSGSSSTIAISASDIASDSSAGSFTSTITDFVTEGLVDNQLFKISGFADSTIDGVYRAKTVTASSVVVYESVSATEAAGASVSVASKRYSNGEQPSYFTFQERVENITTPSFDRFHDAEIDALTIDMSGGIVTSTMDVKAVQRVVATDKNSSTADAAGITTEKMVTYGNLRSVVMDNSLTSFDLSSLNLNIANSLTPIEVVDSTNPVGFSAGTIDVNASIKLYVQDTAEYEKYYQSTQFNMGFHLVDSSDNAIGVFMDNVEYEELSRSGEGQDDDVFYDGKVTASRNSTTGKTVHIDIC